MEIGGTVWRRGGGFSVHGRLQPPTCTPVRRAWAQCPADAVPWLLGEFRRNRRQPRREYSSLFWAGFLGCRRQAGGGGGQSAASF